MLCPPRMRPDRDDQTHRKEAVEEVSGKERTHRWRARLEAGRRIYTAEADEEATEQLLKSFDCETFEQLLERLNMVDSLLVTRHGHGLSPVLLWLINELTKDED